MRAALSFDSISPVRCPLRILYSTGSQMQFRFCGAEEAERTGGAEEAERTGNVGGDRPFSQNIKGDGP
jgi:hypothetical protein